jgi:hypothetical protein
VTIGLFSRGRHKQLRFESVRLHEIESPAVAILGRVADHLAKAGNFLPQELLHSSPECQLCAGSPNAGAHQAHVGIPPHDGQQLDVTSICLEGRPDFLQRGRNAPLEIRARAIRISSPLVHFSLSPQMEGTSAHDR